MWFFRLFSNVIFLCLIFCLIFGIFFLSGYATYHLMMPKKAAGLTSPAAISPTTPEKPATEDKPERVVIDGFTIEKRTPVKGIEWFEVETGEPVMFMEIKSKEGQVKRYLMPDDKGPKGGLWDRFQAQEKQVTVTVPVTKHYLIFLDGKQITVRDYMRLEPDTFYITDIVLGGEPGELLSLRLKSKK